MVWATLQTIQASPTLSLPLSVCRGRLISSAFLADSKLRHSFSPLISGAGGSDFPLNACQEVVRLLMPMAGSCGDSAVGAGGTDWTRVL